MLALKVGLLQYIGDEFGPELAARLLDGNEFDGNIDAFRVFLQQTVVLKPTSGRGGTLPAQDVCARDIPFLEFVDIIFKLQFGAASDIGSADAWLGPAEDSLGKTVRFRFQSSLLKTAMWAKLCERLGRPAFLRLLTGVLAVFPDTSAQPNLKWETFRYRRPAENTYNIRKTRMYYRVSNLVKHIRFMGAPTQVLLDEICGAPIGKSKKVRKLRNLIEHAKRRELSIDYLRLRRSIVTRADSCDTVFAYCSAPNQVIRFVLVVVYRLLPSQTFGSAENRSKLSKAIMTFMLLSRFDTFDVCAFVGSLKVKDIPWLGKSEKITSVQDLELRTTILRGFFKFLFGVLIVRIVSRFWYVTESPIVDASPNLYFPHSTWKRITRVWLQEYILRFLCKVECPFDMSAPQKNIANFGILRLIPKKSDLRPLCVPCSFPIGPEFKKEAHPGFSRKQTFTPDRIRPIRDILRFQQARYVNAYPSSSTGCHLASVVGKKILEFRQRLLQHGGIPPLYGVQFDMKHCYDNLNQAKIITCIEELFAIESNHEEYFLRNVSSYSSSCLSYRKNFNLISVRKDIETLDVAQNDKYAARKDVVVDNGRLAKYNKSHVIDLVRSQVIESVVQIPDDKFQFFKRTRGVFQGFPLLATLCDVVYNSLVDNVILCGLMDKSGTHSLLLRLADDFLFISTSKEVCHKAYVNAVSAEAQRYGAYVNMDKLKFLDSSVPAQSSASFVGLSIDMKSLSIHQGSALRIRIPQSCRKSLKGSVQYILRFLFQRLQDYLIDLDLVTVETALDSIDEILAPILQITTQLFQEAEGLPERAKLAESHVFNIVNGVIQRWTTVNGDGIYLKCMGPYLESVFNRMVEAIGNIPV
ncbi:hypothetical protein PUMCH_003593 [Australozyma saopauloensis]|uniref:Telomerase reverse transcriptase n=1 Tax=Australozyma saopauloensis TaxID=291208 RepID=A0AAX4HCS5_9ASCO|nr:hypothetical protein PUMCH_003593 [[Candida] saopauloensis]